MKNDFILAQSQETFAQRGIIDVEVVQIPVVNVLNSNSFVKYNSYEK